MTERKITEVILKQLKKAGYEPKTEYSLPLTRQTSIRADIGYLDSSGKLWLFEVKKIRRIENLITAIGQATLYSAWGFSVLAIDRPEIISKSDIFKKIPYPFLLYDYRRANFVNLPYGLCLGCNRHLNRMIQRLKEADYHGE